MRVRQLLAANAFCLLAALHAACGKEDQIVGRYRLDEPPPRVSNEPEPPQRPNDRPAASGSEGAPVADAGFPPTVIDEPVITSPEPMAGAAGARSPFPLPPPTLLDGGTAPMPNPANPAACVLQLAETARRGLDMYLMVDNNSTLPTSGAWEDVSTGLQMFALDPRSRGTGVAIRYFGLGCDEEGYKTPDVDFAVLPNHSREIINSTRTRRWTASPMLPALKGAIALQQDRTKSHPQSKQIVVLVSDALTQDFTCLYTPQALAEAAREAYEEHGIETHVIGVGVTTSIIGPLDDLLTRLGAYNAIAAAGGTGKAITTDFNEDGAAFNEAIQTVRSKAAPCEFAAPSGVQDDQFGVAFYPSAKELKRFSSERACGNDTGWYYATESAPTPVTLCPASCEQMRQLDGTIRLLLPCPEDP